MNYEEAKRAYIRIKADMDRFGCVRDGKDIAVALEAIDRMIPKKPKKTLYDEHLEIIDYYCPICDAFITDDTIEEYFPHCENCGQAIDWEEDEE